MVEKDVIPDVEKAYHLKASFAKLGWENFFNIPNFYYEEFVLEFYANVEDKKGTFNQKCQIGSKMISSNMYLILVNNLQTYSGIG